MVDKKDGAPKGWGKVKPPVVRKFISVGGIYNVLVKEAWDSKFQLPGSWDADRKDPTKRYLGYDCVVVDEGEQEGRFVTLKMWIHTDAMQSHALNSFNIMNLEMDEDIGPSTGLSIGDAAVGQYLKVTVTMSQPKKDGDKIYPEAAPWDVEEPDSQYKNEMKQLTGDEENLPSVAHYERDVEYRKKAADKKADESSSSEQDDDLPF